LCQKGGYEERKEKKKRGFELNALKTACDRWVSFHKRTSNRGLLKLEEFISNKSNDKTRLSYGCVSQENEFEVVHTASWSA
jgi:hypothetical protein